MRYAFTKDCAVKGCTRADHKAGLCKKHYALVPRTMVNACMIGCMEASMREADRHHRKMRAHVRSLDLVL